MTLPQLNEFAPPLNYLNTLLYHPITDKQMATNYPWMGKLINFKAVIVQKNE